MADKGQECDVNEERNERNESRKEGQERGNERQDNVLGEGEDERKEGNRRGYKPKKKVGQNFLIALTGKG